MRTVFYAAAYLLFANVLASCATNGWGSQANMFLRNELSYYQSVAGANGDFAYQALRFGSSFPGYQEDLDSIFGAMLRADRWIVRQDFEANSQTYSLVLLFKGHGQDRWTGIARSNYALLDGQRIMISDEVMTDFLRTISKEDGIDLSFQLTNHRRIYFLSTYDGSEVRRFSIVEPSGLPNTKEFKVEWQPGPRYLELGSYVQFIDSLF